MTMKRFRFIAYDKDCCIIFDASEYAETRYEALQKLVQANWTKKQKQDFHHIEILEAE
jgi:hypothetical protein